MYLIIGANGYLGAYMMKNVLSETQENMIATARHASNLDTYDGRVTWRELDVTDFGAVEKLAEHLPCDIADLNIIYLAAYHHPDEVEENPKIAWDINVTALSHFLNVFRGIRCLVYPSTDTVYGESPNGKPLDEHADLNPVNTYGKQKIVAEKLVTSFGQHVCRYPFLIAPSLVTHKKHFYDIIADTITSGKTMEMFSDSFRSSLDFDTVARLTVRLIEKKDFPEIINVSGDDKLSKYDIGIMIAKKLNVPKNRIIPVTVKKDTSIFKAPRASVTILDNSLIKKVLDLDNVKIHI